MLQKQEQSGLILVGATIGIIGLAVGITGITHMVNPIYLALIMTVLEYVVLACIICGRYYEFNNLDKPLIRFVPLLSELSILSGNIYVGYLVSMILTAICVVLGSPLTGTLFGGLGANVTVAITYYAWVGAVFFFLLLSLVRGVGYIKIRREITATLEEIFNIQRSKVSPVMDMLFFIPVLRVFPMTFLMQDLGKMEMNAVTADLERSEENSFEMEED